MKKRGTQQLQLNDAPHYRFRQALYMAFYSKRLYQDVAARWKGLGLKYMLFLTACALLPLSMVLIKGSNQYLNDYIIYPFHVLPPLYIHQGEVTFHEKMPYLIRNSAEEVIGIVDTTGMTKGVNSGYYPQLTWVLTKNTLYFRPPPIPWLSQKNINQKPSEIIKKPLDADLNTIFLAEEWYNSSPLPYLKIFFSSILYPCLVAFIASISLSLWFALAWLAQFVASVIFKVKLSYQTSFRLLTVALTPPFFIFFGTLAIGIIVPGIAWAYLALLSAYFSFAVVMIKYSNKSLTLTSLRSD
jgi:hypothetical protein